MATKPITGKFEHLIVEVETATPGTFTKICGITSRGIQRQHNMNTTEVPQDCDDESLPVALERDIQSSEVTISGSGVWAAQSNEMMLDWWYSGATKNVRVNHALSAVGDTQYETGPAYLVSVSNQAEKGQRVTAELEIQFDGVPTRTPRAA